MASFDQNVQRAQVPRAQVPRARVPRAQGSRGLAMLVCIVLIATASRALAFSTGVSTLNFGPLGCNGCHTGGQTPAVALMGPTTVAPSSTNDYTLVITSVGSQTFGGFNVSAAFGVFSTGGADASQTQPTTGTGDRIEITHVSRKAANNGMIKFSFRWTAPDSFSSVAFNAWGNAVNGNTNTTGDAAALISLNVVSSMPGPNPTNTPLPPPTATATPIVHDIVLSAVKPLNVSLPVGATTVAKSLSVKVTDADPKDTAGQAVSLNVTNGCPAAVTVGLPTFDGVPGAVFLKPGQSKVAKVLVSITSDAFTTLNRAAAGRCTLAFIGGSSPPSLDPNPSNNSVAAEINVTDKNDPDQATVDESFVQSLVPLKLTLPPLATSIAKTVKAAVGNADILPAPETPGYPISVTVSDGDCPAGTVGTVVPDTVTVKGGKKQSVSFTVTVDSAQFTTTSAKSPARCTAEVTATGPVTPDPDPTNNTTKLVIDVIDKNDF